MKRFLLTATFFWAVCAQAQLRVGVQGGYSRVRWTSVNTNKGAFDDSYTTAGLDGFQFGGVTEIKLSGKWLLRPALFISGKGTTLNHENWHNTSSRGIWVRYVEVPVALVYQARLNQKLTGFAGGGF